MHLSDFDFTLPSELIAQQPAEPRDSARLLVYERSSDTIRHAHVRDLASFLPPQTTLVANNSRVRQARLLCQTESGREVELLLLESLKEQRYRCLVGGHSVKAGLELEVLDHTNQLSSLKVVVEGREEMPGMNTYIVRFLTEPSANLESLIETHGHVPLPPYITESKAAPERYQTTYAKELGSAAAPTAGLHFTPKLIQSLTAAGHNWEEITLHVGLGTFLPLRSQEVEANHLHQEQTLILPETAQAINQALEQHHPILAVGTTSTRTLESHYEQGVVQAGLRQTELFIYPGYQFHTLNLLLTNFHLPHSSLLLLVSAFLGNASDNSSVALSEAEMIRRLHHIYETAIREKYRFFSFGDAMLIR